MRRFYITIGESEFIASTDGTSSVQVEGLKDPVEIRTVGLNEYLVLVDGKSISVAARGENGRYDALVNGKAFELKVESERDRHLREFEDEGAADAVVTEIRAPMPAMVVLVEVSTGDTVKDGKGLIVLEAMKMENEIKAQHEGTVSEILVKKGDSVEKGELLMRLE